jgi:hypothetical protein
MLHIGQLVNNYVILTIVQSPHDEEEVFILGKSDNGYVTARMSKDVDTSWYWGEYYTNITYRVAWNNFSNRFKEQF